MKQQIINLLPYNLTILPVKGKPILFPANVAAKHIFVSDVGAEAHTIAGITVVDIADGCLQNIPPALPNTYYITSRMVQIVAVSRHGRMDFLCPYRVVRKDGQIKGYRALMRLVDPMGVR